MKHRKGIEAFGELTLESFRLNGRLLAIGDQIASEVGMTSARWQVLGTLILAGDSITVAEIARRMGLARQSVQRIADALVAEKLMRYCDNPRHPRWKLVQPTAKGKRLHAQLEQRRSDWSVEVIEGVQLEDLRRAADVLKTIRKRLSADIAEESI